MIHTILTALATAATTALSFPVRLGYNAEAVSKEQIWLTATATPLSATAAGVADAWDMSVTVTAATLAQSVADGSGVAIGDPTGSRRAAMLTAVINWMQSSGPAVSVSGYDIHAAFNHAPRGAQAVGDEYVAEIATISLAISKT